ncbi:unnamed protein product [Rhizophagus irregularis]|nr:unnamed protein product [Rhizophagus irregularis]
MTPEKLAYCSLKERKKRWRRNIEILRDSDLTSITECKQLKIRITMIGMSEAGLWINMLVQLQAESESCNLFTAPIKKSSRTLYQVYLLLNMQSGLDSLKQHIVELLADNDEIKAENAKVKVENAKLRQAMEENEARLAKLGQSDKKRLNSLQNSIVMSGKSSRSELLLTLQHSLVHLINRWRIRRLIILSLDEDDIQVIDGKQELTTDMTIEVELAHLFLEVSIEGVNTPPTSQASKTNQANVLEAQCLDSSGPVNSPVTQYGARAPFINVALKEYSYLSLYNSDKHNDVYEFKNLDLCPRCEKKHNEGKVVGQCIKGSYYIKCRSSPCEEEIKVRSSNKS